MGPRDCIPFEGSREELLSLPFPASSKHLYFHAHGPYLHHQNQRIASSFLSDLYIHTYIFSLTVQPPSCKEPCDYLGLAG